MVGSGAFKKALEQVPKLDPNDPAGLRRIRTSDLPDPLSGFEEYEAQLRALSDLAANPGAVPPPTPSPPTPAAAPAIDYQPTSQPTMRLAAPDEPEQLVLGFEEGSLEPPAATSSAPASATSSAPGIAQPNTAIVDPWPTELLPDVVEPVTTAVRPFESALPIALDARAITPSALTARVPTISLQPKLDSERAPRPSTESSAAPRRPRAGRTTADSRLAWSLLIASIAGFLVLFFGVDQGWFTLDDTIDQYVDAGLGLLAAGAGVTLAGRRDVISWSTLADIATLAVSVATFSWQFPRFASGTTVWDPDQRLPLTAVGVAIGLLFGAIIVLSLLRRPQSLSSAAFVGALGLVLAWLVIAPQRADLALPILASAAAVAVAGWLLRRRTEQTWGTPGSRLRLPRSVLSLVAAAIAAVGLQITLARGDFNDAIPVIVLFVLVLVASLFSIFSSRNELREEEGAMADWLSWRKELQSGDFETSIFEYSPAANPGISEWTADGRLIHGDELFWRMLDLPPADHCDLLASVHADDRVNAAQAFVRAVRTATVLSHRCRFQRDSDGMVRAFEMRGEPLPNGAYRLSLFELTPDEAIDRRSDPGGPGGIRHDPLTGVANIARLDHWLHEFALNSRRHSDAALIIIVEVGDLALFEQADPRVRDLVLTESAHRLQSACRAGDFVAHVDGPYFAVVAKLATPNDEAGLVNRIQQLISGTIPVFGQELAMNGRLIPLHVDPGVVLDQVLDTAAAAFHTSNG